MKKFLPVSLLLTLCLTLLTPSLAKADYSVDQVRQYVDGVASQTLSVISGGGTKETKKQALEKIFAAQVDIPWVGRFVLGRFWRDATPAQRSNYLKEYKSFLLANYATRFAQYSSGTYKITSATDDGDAQYTVSMTMAGADQSQPVQVDYKIHVMEDGKLRLFDVVVEGVSMITTQRSEFASVLGQKGLDYLIQQLANKSLPLPDEKKS